MEEDRRVDHLLLFVRQRRGEPAFGQYLGRQVAPQLHVPRLGSDGCAGEHQTGHAESGSDLPFGHLAPARVVEDEGDVHDELVDLSRVLRISSPAKRRHVAT